MNTQSSALEPRRGDALSQREIRLTPFPPPQSDGPTLNLVTFIRILARRKVWIYASVAILLVLAATVCLVMKPRYKSEAQIQVLKHELGTIAVSDRENRGAEESGDALDFNISMQTQAAVLKSDTLALRVIKELNLAENPDFRYAPLFTTAEMRRQMDLPLEQAPRKRAYILRQWSKNLNVDAIAGTRMINVSYTHTDPKMASRIVNQLLSDFIDYNFQVRYTAISKASDWLGGELAGLKAQVEQSQQHAAQLQKDTGIFGTDETHNVALTRLEQLNAQVAATETNRFMKEAVYKLARDGDPEVAASLLGSSQGGGPLTGTTPALLISLRQQEAALDTQYAEAAAKYGSDHPRLLQIKGQLNAVRANLKDELDKVAKRAGNEYTVALSSEAAAKNAFQQQTAVASKMNSKAIDFMIAKHEADSNRELYDRLLQRVKEAGVVAGLHSNDINVVNRALVPDSPSKPNIPLYMAFGSLTGLMLGLACAFVSETMDCTLRNPAEIEATTSVPVLGIIPSEQLGSPKDRPKAQNRLAGKNTATVKRLKSLVTSDQSMVAEAFRALRASLLLSRPGLPAKVIMMTSGLPFEGKTFTSLNLAATLAQNGSKVLLVDADFRHGSLTRNLLGKCPVGLAQLLAQDCDVPCQQIKEVPGLTFLGAGACPSHTAELLGSEKMAAAIRSWRESFDFVVIDTPPVLALSDAIVLSPNVDAVVLVVRFAVSTRQSIARVIRTFRDVHVECRGAIVNGMDVRSTDYFQYSGAYGDKNNYGYADSPQQFAGASANTKLKGEHV